MEVIMVSARPRALHRSKNGPPYPSRLATLVCFAWPEGIPLSDPEAALADVRVNYQTPPDWEIVTATAHPEVSPPHLLLRQRRRYPAPRARRAAARIRPKKRRRG